MPRRGQRRGAERRAQLRATAPGDWLHGEDGRWRIGWRFLAFLVLSAAGTFAAVFVLGMLTSVGASLGLRLILYPLAAPLGLFAAHFVAVRRLEGGAWSYVSMDRAATRPWVLGRATLLGGAAIALPSAVLLGVGYLAIVPAADGSSLFAAAYLIWILVPAAFAEELLARGYLFSLVREGWGWPAALLASSAAFGLLHLANPGSNPQSILTVVLAGLFLGLVLLRYASLYAATAAHAAWNLVLAAVMHTEVSGITISTTPDYRVVDSGPDWLTGGAWGPEGGAAAAAGLAVASILLLRPLLAAARARPLPEVSTSDGRMNDA